MTTKTWATAAIAFLAGGLLAGALLAPAVMRSDKEPPEMAGREGRAESHEAAPEAPVRYYCPMHPTMISDTPGDCPICDMRMVPIEEPQAGPPGAGPADRSAGHQAATEGAPPGTGAAARPPVAGYTTISVPAHKQQYIGVKTTRVERRTLSHAVEAVGRVDYDESRLSWVNTRVEGWIESLHADRTGEFVLKGDPILDLYSPELVSTQEEYLIALRNLARLEASGAIPTAIAQARSLVEAARQRLDLWEIPGPQVRALEERGSVTRRMTIEAPVSGYVIDKTALLGKHVAPGENLYRIADLSTVWILAEVYESQAPLIRKGQEVQVGVSYEPGLTFSARVDHVYPYLDPTTRTIRVRVVTPNPDLKLRPEMYVKAVFRIEERETPLVVPNEALLDTGERLIAFVRRDEGTFEPREIRAGLRTGEYTAVIEGLLEGEEVVTSGNFLIDSESRLRAALEGMAAAAGGHRHGG